MYNSVSENLTFLPHGVVLCLNLPTTLFNLCNILSNNALVNSIVKARAEDF